MTDRRRALLGLSAAATALLALAMSGTASADQAVASAAPGLDSVARRPFVVPRPRPTEDRGRPTDDPDPNRNAYAVPQAEESPYCGRNFCVHWVEVGLDAPNLTDRNGNGVPDYVERVLGVAEHVHSIENGKLGWREPKSDGYKGGGNGKTDIYLTEVGPQLFGYAAPDPGQSTKRHRIPRRLYGYLVIDNDYKRSEFPRTTQEHDLEVTLAHEYNHILQFGYDAYQDPWFAESSATWMEDQVYNGINDYLRYVKRWVHRFDTPLTASSIKEYGSAVWNEWLAHHYGLGIVRDAWADAIHSRPGGFSVDAYEAAIRAAGNSDFSQDFTHFAADVAEWRTGKGFRESYLYPDMTRQGSLHTDGVRLRRRLNHTTFQMLRVGPRSGRAVVVRMTAPAGTAAGLALVGRIGSERHGRPVERIAYSERGGDLSVRLPDPGRFQRITAVLVNADARARGFSTRRLDWGYLTDHTPFEVSARLIR